MDTNTEKPKVRVVKAGQRLRSGLIRVEGAEGTVYRGGCDRCEVMVTVTRPPQEGRELLCQDCRHVAKAGKPTTRVKRRGGKALFYLTKCDECGNQQKTPFLPKKSREFLCDSCYQEEREERRAAEREERRAALTARAEAETEAKAAAEEAEEALATVEETESSPEPTEETVAAVQTAVSPEIEAPREKEPPPVFYSVSCNKCQTQVKMKFQPKPGETFICRDCYDKSSDEEKQNMGEKRKDKHETRLMFHIECVVCGKNETVNFVPKSLSEPICTECFNKKRRK